MPYRAVPAGGMTLATPWPSEVAGHGLKGWRTLMESPEPLLQFFTYAHLPESLRLTSQPFAELAQWMVDCLPRNPERTVALRKLLEAKDCAVRAKLWQG